LAGATVALVGASSPSGGVAEPEPVTPALDVGVCVPDRLFVIVAPPADDEGPLIDAPLPVDPVSVTEPSCEPCADAPPLTVSALPVLSVEVEVIEPVAPTGSFDVVVNVSSVVVTGGGTVIARGVTGGAGGAIVCGAVDAGGWGEGAEVIVLFDDTIAVAEALIVCVGSVSVVGAAWRSCAGTASSVGVAASAAVASAAAASVAAASIAAASAAVASGGVVASGVAVVSVVAGAGAAGGVATGAGNAPVVLSTIGAFANGSGFGLAVAFFGCGRVT
jgi:hypothetical protein